jgi:hypothetical protein
MWTYRRTDRRDLPNKHLFETKLTKGNSYVFLVGTSPEKNDFHTT